MNLGGTIIPNSILVTSATATNDQGEEMPALAVRFGHSGLPQRTSSPVLAMGNLESPARTSRIEFHTIAATGDPEIEDENSEGLGLAPAAAHASLNSTSFEAPGPINTNSNSYRSILAQPGLARTITGESRNIKIITAASQKSQSMLDVPMGEMSVSVTPAGLLDANLPIPRFPGLGIFYTDVTSGIPGVFAHLVNNLGTIPDCVVFATINYANYPHVEEKDRLFVTKGLLNGFWKAVLTLGYMDEIIDR